MIKKIFEKIGSGIKALFLSGFFTLLPIAATIFVVTFTYKLIAKWLIPLRKLQPQYLAKIPGFEFILVTVAIFLIGFMVKFFLISPIIHYFERIIKKIPIIRTIYSSAKILVNFFNISTPSAAKNKKVVLIQFPKKGFYNIAFQLDSAKDNFQKLLPEEKIKEGKTYYKVFMPNSPNPATGYFLIMPEDEITPTNMTFEEAIKAIVSCGLISPRSLND